MEILESSLNCRLVINLRKKTILLLGESKELVKIESLEEKFRFNDL